MTGQLAAFALRGRVGDLMDIMWRAVAAVIVALARPIVWWVHR